MGFFRDLFRKPKIDTLVVAETHQTSEGPVTMAIPVNPAQQAALAQAQANNTTYNQWSGSQPWQQAIINPSHSHGYILTGTAGTGTYTVPASPYYTAGAGGQPVGQWGSLGGVAVPYPATNAVYTYYDLATDSIQHGGVARDPAEFSEDEIELAERIMEELGA